MTTSSRLGQGTLALVVVGLVACDRSADIRDEHDPVFLPKAPKTDDDMLVPVDVELGPPAYPGCMERSETACYGDSDFPCNFDGWAAKVIDRCQAESGCATNGDVEVTLAPNGCVDGLAMTQPNDAFVACVAAAFGEVRCPCEEALTFGVFLGLGNGGCDG
ncbi:MAG: hypothetical protein FJ096_10470 [Deltaproteobacteria bacterium]|nr:hypothetical protein [Deltaproteobacteria bacterium]